MVGLLVLLVVAGTGFALWAAQRVRRRDGTVAGVPEPSTAATPAAAVVAALDRAVAAGLLTRATADAVLAQESLAQAAAAPAAHRSHRPVLASAVEGLGYVGGVLVLVGVMLIVAQFWEDLATAARLVLIGGAGAGLLTVGLLLQAEEVPVVWRLRGFLLLLSAGAVAGTAAILMVDVVAAPGPVVALVIGSATGAYGAALWRRHDRPAQHLTTFIGLAVAVGAAGSWLGGSAATGALIAVLGLTWAALGRANRLAPRTVAIVLGTAAALVGPGIIAVAWPQAGPAIGLLLAAMFAATGPTLDEPVLTGCAVAGLLVYLPWAVGAVFGDAVGPPVVMVLSGAVLLIATVALVTRSKRNHPGVPAGSAPS